MMETLWPNIAANVIATAIISAGGWLTRRISNRWWPDPRAKLAAVAGLCLVWFLLNLGTILGQPWNPAVFFTVTTIVLGYVLRKEIWPLYRVGITGADIQVRTGINYEKALRLARNNLDFLGTGASKLTATGPVFEDALTRCHRAGRPVRFLLMHPDRGTALEKAANRAGVASGEYRRRVTQSLRQIAEITRRRSLNVEVRLYEEPPEFRLMFIDESLCLASFNVYGEGDGSQLPQLHVVRRTNQQDTRSFYYPLAEYFRELWNRSEPWDPDAWDQES